MTTSEAAPDTETTHVIAVHGHPLQRNPFTVTCGVPLAVVACAALPVARDLVRAGRGLALRPAAVPAAVASVHGVTS